MCIFIIIVLSKVLGSALRSRWTPGPRKAIRGVRGLAGGIGPVDGGTMMMSRDAALGRSQARRRKSRRSQSTSRQSRSSQSTSPTWSDLSCFSWGGF